MVSGTVVSQNVFDESQTYPSTVQLFNAVVEALQRDAFPSLCITKIRRILSDTYQVHEESKVENLPAKNSFELPNIRSAIQSCLSVVRTVQDLDHKGESRRWGVVLNDMRDVEHLGGGELPLMCVNADMVSAFEHSPLISVRAIACALLAGTYVHEIMHIVHMHLFPNQADERTHPLLNEQIAKSGFVLAQEVFGGRFGVIWDMNHSGRDRFENITDLTLWRQGKTYSIPATEAIMFMDRLLGSKEFYQVEVGDTPLPDPQPPLVQSRIHGEDEIEEKAEPLHGLPIAIPPGHVLSLVGDH